MLALLQVSVKILGLLVGVEVLVPLTLALPEGVMEVRLHPSEIVKD